MDEARQWLSPLGVKTMMFCNRPQARQFDCWLQVTRRQSMAKQFKRAGGV